MRLARSLMLVAGCSFGEAEPVLKTVSNAGRVCLRGSTTPEGEVYAENAPVTIVYETPGCLSAGCDRDRQAWCGVVVVDGALGIASSATWNDYSHRGGACTDDCGLIRALCDTNPLPANTYPVRYGPTSIATLVVPSTLAEPLCLEAE